MSLDVTLRKDENEMYWANITHNLNTMAEEAGIYKELWRPDEIGATHAKDIIEPLKVGLTKMVTDPAYYKGFNPPNGWGTYDNFLLWIVKYLQACIDNPDALIEVSR